MARFCYLCVLSLMLFQLLLCQATEDDIRCLNETKLGLKDPNQLLSSWQFGNGSGRGFTCKFVGIQCWHNDDDKVLSIKLPGMGLAGTFPTALNYCSSMTNLDLSDNNLSGAIPSDLCKWLPYLVQLDLSGNQFTGSIPTGLANCTYLNILRLNGNRLSGAIPFGLTQLQRLHDFNFANNGLAGKIPSLWANSSSKLFEGNPGLCGKPLSNRCGESRYMLNM